MAKLAWVTLYILCANFDTCSRQSRSCHWYTTVPPGPAWCPFFSRPVPPISFHYKHTVHTHTHTHNSAETKEEPHILAAAPPVRTLCPSLCLCARLSVCTFLCNLKLRNVHFCRRHFTYNTHVNIALAHTLTLTHTLLLFNLFRSRRVGSTIQCPHRPPARSDVCKMSAHR